MMITTLFAEPAKPDAERWTLDLLVEVGSLSQPAADFLTGLCWNPLRIIVAGGVGSGKTAVLEALCGEINEQLNTTVIEDASELSMPEANTVMVDPSDSLFKAAQALSLIHI